MSIVKEHWESWLSEQKVEDIRAFSLEGVSDLVDEMLVATAQNSRHLKFLAEDAMKRARDLDVSLIAADGLDGREWVVLDFGIYMLHLLLPGVRETLQLEDLYKRMKRPEEDQY